MTRLYYHCSSNEILVIWYNYYMQYKFLSAAFIPCYREGSIRVANGTYTYSRNFDGGATYAGRIEVCYNGSYGSVCDVGWDEEDASIVCRNSFGIENGYSKYSLF